MLFANVRADVGSNFIAIIAGTNVHGVGDESWICIIIASMLWSSSVFGPPARRLNSTMASLLVQRASRGKAAVVGKPFAVGSCAWRGCFAM
jgi:hypothetical protein